MDELFLAIQPYFQSLKDIYFLGNSAFQYVQAIVVFFALLFLLNLIGSRLIVKLQKFATKTNTIFDDALIMAIKKLKAPFYVAIACYGSFYFITLGNLFDKIITVALVLIIFFQFMKSIAYLIDYASNIYLERSVEKTKRAHAGSMLRLLRNLILVALWVVIGVTILANFGINVTSIIAGLGIGGIAVALALQSVLGDMFSSFTIFLDKPFQVGDFISLGENSGTVQHIGLKTTRIKLLRGEELIIPNKTLTSSEIQNFKQLQKRRVSMLFSVEYTTSQTKLELIPGLLKEIVDPIELVSFGRCHLTAFGASSIDFELVYFIDKSDYDLFMDKKQEILLGMFQHFTKQKIVFAYPTQVVYVKK